MGEGGYLKINNATKYTLRRINIASYQMNEWDKEFPQEIKPQTSSTVHIEWNENVFLDVSKDHGEAQYEIVELDCHFEVQAKVECPGRGKLLQVDWQNTIKDPDFRSLPPPQLLSELGWKHNGVVELTLNDTKGAIENSPHQIL